MAYTDFDTFSLMQRSSKAQSQATAAHSKAGHGTHALKSVLSGSSVARRRRDDSENQNADMKQVDLLSKNGGNLLSEQLETGSLSSTGIVSTAAIVNNKDHQSQQLQPLSSES